MTEITIGGDGLRQHGSGELRMFGMYELLLVASVIVIGVVIPVVAVFVLVAWARRNSPKPTAVNPNLFPCPDCSREVSKRAPACPHCGAPLTARH